MLSQTILLTTSALVCATQEELTKEEELPPEKAEVFAIQPSTRTLEGV
jgi:hypothetical protein